eukprot:TRINITY_DN4846_c0_g1_i1.p1 TRINITY_DN4846_c0_g1~~TRINITY_DN4846_c0_g1_i1.p1  ORF type:complete len:503 (-),score=127.31 TRINITY_DN4846_c0_g1_i1:137-1645(-)
MDNPTFMMYRSLLETNETTNGTVHSNETLAFYEEIYKIGCWTGSIFSILATLFTIKVMWGHLKFYNEPELQRLIVRIVMMIPIYAIDSMFSIIFPEWALIFDTLRDCYEAYVIYVFFSLLVRFIETSQFNLMKYLSEQPPHKHPIPLCCFHFSPGGVFMHTCKQMILQYTIVKPILAGLVIFLELRGTYHEGDFSPKYGYLYVCIIENISVTLALYYLVLFYLVSHDPLEPFRPVAKFLCVKMIIFFTFWQGIVISGLVFWGFLDDEAWGRGIPFSVFINDWLICIEMLFFALAFGYAFGVKTYRNVPESARAQVAHQITSILNPKKFKSDMNDVKRIMHNFKDVLSQKDMVEDTVDAFGKKGRRYLNLGDFTDVSLDEQRQRVLKEGPLMKCAAKISLWKERYFVLINNPAGIIYFDHRPFPEFDESDSLSAGQQNKTLVCPPLEFIPLDEISNVEIIEGDPKNGYGINIVTSNRKWYLRAKTIEDRDAWADAIRHNVELP